MAGLSGVSYIFRLPTTFGAEIATRDSPTAARIEYLPSETAPSAGETWPSTGVKRIKPSGSSCPSRLTSPVTVPWLAAVHNKQPARIQKTKAKNTSGKRRPAVDRQFDSIIRHDFIAVHRAPGTPSCKIDFILCEAQGAVAEDYVDAARMLTARICTRIRCPSSCRADPRDLADSAPRAEKVRDPCRHSARSRSCTWYRACRR